VARIAWILLILVTLYLCYFQSLGAVGLVGPDEPRYAWIARDMAESGDWVTPRLYGQPWFEKPALYYWGAALSFKLFGVNEAAARFPSALAALLATLATAWLSWRVYGAETARWLLLLLPTTVGMIGFSHAAATDMPFVGMLSIAMVCVAVVLGMVRDNDSPILPRTPWLALMFFGFFLGLAVLAKGPAAIILSAGAVLLWATFTKRWRDALRCLHPVAIASFCLTALPWYILCSRRNPDFFRIFIIEHNFNRYLTPEFQHIQPFWYYIPIVLIALFPWFLFLVPAMQRAIASGRRNDSDGAVSLFFLVWAAFPLVFFSISKSKLPGYILPALPPLAVLLATAVAKTSVKGTLSARWPLWASGFAMVLFGILLEQQSGKFPVLFCTSPTCGITRIWLIAVGGGMVMALVALLGRDRLSLLALVSTTLFLVIEIDRFLPELNPGISSSDAAQVVRHVWPDFSPDRAATWQLNRSYVYELNFYFRRDLPEWRSQNLNADWVFVAKNKVTEARASGLDCVGFAIYPAVVPCRNPASLGRLSGLGGLHGSSGNSTDRQPR
jgi:4-amino-4-deoxy-L-arabinose transferase-like glycosyltransferase